MSENQKPTYEELEELVKNQKATIQFYKEENELLQIYKAKYDDYTWLESKNKRLKEIVRGLIDFI